MEPHGSNTELAERKRQLRSTARAERDAIPAALREAWSAQACAAVVEWLRSRQEPVRSVMVYAPFRSELDTGPIMEWAWGAGIAVILPRCQRADRSMELYAIAGKDDLTAGAYGIPEPDAGRATICDRSFVPGAVIVPGLAFDRQGGRLGYGGGYYDRFAQRLVRSAAAAGIAAPPWIGLCFEAQVCRLVPMDIRDARMDALAAENGVAICEPVGDTGQAPRTANRREAE